MLHPQESTAPGQAKGCVCWGIERTQCKRSPDPAGGIERHATAPNRPAAAFATSQRGRTGPCALAFRPRQPRVGSGPVSRPAGRFNCRVGCLLPRVRLRHHGSCKVVHGPGEGPLFSPCAGRSEADYAVALSADAACGECRCTCAVGCDGRHCIQTARALDSHRPHRVATPMSIWMSSKLMPQRAAWAMVLSFTRRQTQTIMVGAR